VKIVVVIGMPAAGKDIVRKYAETGHYQYISTGDIVRREAKKRGLNANPENMAGLSDELRGEDGSGVTRMALGDALKSGADLVFLEGMRSWKEIELIREKNQCLLVAVVAPRNIRLARVLARKRADDSAEFFDRRDWREINYGLAACIALADDYIFNAGTIADAYSEIDRIVKKYTMTNC
jgi:dephospho-CoA kinase